MRRFEPKYGNPPHRICEICNDDGKCLNNETNPNYDDDFFGSDIYDCVDYLEKKNNTQGQFMRGYIKNLQKKETEHKSKGGFNEWSSKH